MIRLARYVRIAAGLSACVPPAYALASDVASRVARTEERAACERHEPLRRPLFGDLHVHTSLSFDSYISSQRNDPAAA